MLWRRCVLLRRNRMNLVLSANLMLTRLDLQNGFVKRVYDAIIVRSDALNAAAVAEYGAPVTATAGRTEFAAKIFLLAKSSMEEFEFERIIGKSKVVYEPLGVAALITPWNADYVHIA